MERVLSPKIEYAGQRPATPAISGIKSIQLQLVPVAVMANATRACPATMRRLRHSFQNLLSGKK